MDKNYEKFLISINSIRYRNIEKTNKPELLDDKSEWQELSLSEVDDIFSE